MAPSPKKLCMKCRKAKSVRSFSGDVTRGDGLYPYCKPCQMKYGRDNNIQDPGAPLNGKDCPLCDTPLRGRANRAFCSSYCRDRVKSLKTRYGLTPQQFRALLDANQGQCPICHQKPKKWCVDHDHVSGLVTGLVCTRCNVGLLAYSSHKPEVAERLFRYLVEYPAVRIIGPVVVPDDPDGRVRGTSKLHQTWGR